MNFRLETLFRLWPWTAVLAIFALGITRTRAQFLVSPDDQPAPDWGLIIPRLRYFETDVEAEDNTFHSSGAGTQENRRLYVSPRLGLGWNGYIFHPYLLNYSALMEPGYVWQEQGPPSTMSGSRLWMLNGNLTANILEVKPYASTVSYDRAHQETKYDFFHSATVDSEGWGASSGYREGPIPVTVSFLQSHEDSEGANQIAKTDQTTVNFRANNERSKLDTTDLSYQYSQFNRETEVVGANYRTDNDYHHVTLADVEHFENSTLKSLFLFSKADSPNSSSSDLSATIDYNIEHNPNLHSFYDYSFLRTDDDASDSIQNYGAVGLQHQLYESLSSSFDLHASSLRNDSSGTTFDSTSGGANGSLSYTKRLGDWGRLSIGNSASYNITDQQTSGDQLVIADESHMVPATGLVRLNQPSDIGIIAVTDATHKALIAGADYTVIKTTDPWQIQINNSGPSNIQPGATILVTYTIKPNPTGSYSQFNNSSQISLRFLHDLAGVYTRYTIANAWADEPGFVLENSDEFQTGADFSWRGFRVQGDFTDRHSTLYNFRSYALAESYNFKSSEHSSVGINLNQQWDIFPAGSGTSSNQTQQVTFYSAMLDFQWYPMASFNWRTEAGVQAQRGNGFNQDLFAVRTYLNWFVGKLEMHLGCQHETQDINGENRGRDFLFFRIRRNF